MELRLEKREKSENGLNRIQIKTGSDIQPV